MTVLRLLQRRGRILEVAGVDMIEGTPILDIKPYTPRDRKPDARFGWLERTLVDSAECTHPAPSPVEDSEE